MITEPHIDAVTERIFNEIQFPDEPAGLYDPLRYMIAIGGKRIRPRLCLTTYAVFKNRFTPKLLEVAGALEVFHTFTLLHDDIMDRSPLRRGQETVWKKWDEDTAILSGDVMQIDAYKRIAKAPGDKLEAVLGLFSKTAAEVCEGQQFDMEFERVPEVPMKEYCKMIGLKTAVLLACSAKMGALMAGAGEKECQALYDYGYQLGMAFQVADDYLDAFGDEKVFGKKIGGDISNNKKTWLLVECIRRADAARKQRLQEYLRLGDDARDKKVAAVQDLYVELGVKEAAEAEILVWHRKAMEALSRAGLDPDRTVQLERFAEDLIHRER